MLIHGEAQRDGRWPAHETPNDEMTVAELMRALAAYPPDAIVARGDDGWRCINVRRVEMWRDVYGDSTPGVVID